MRDYPHSNLVHGRSAGGSLTATTHRPVGDNAASDNGQCRIVTPDADGLNLDAMEHVRQDRLMRWQTPPTTTREAAA